MNVTAIMGLRLGDRLRRRNTHACLRALADQQDVEITTIVVEQDTKSRMGDLVQMADLHLFRRDPGLYNRGANFNYGVQLARTDVLLLTDADVLFERDTVAQACDHLNKRMRSCRVVDHVLYHSQRSTPSIIRQRFSGARCIERYGRPEKTAESARGGAMVITRDAYYRAGGHDERFEGWGGEDDEFHQRLKTRVGRQAVLARPLHHLWHQRAFDTTLSGKRNYQRFRDIRYGRADAVPPNQVGGIAR